MPSCPPSGWPELLLKNIGQPFAIVASVYLLTAAWVGFVYSVAAAKLIESL